MRRFILGIILAPALAAALQGGVRQASAQDTTRPATDNVPATDTLAVPAVDSARSITDSIPAADTAAGRQASDTLVQLMLPPLDSLRRLHSPRRAGLYSAVLPGLGQVYNHQYVKVPLMLGGLGVATGIFLWNFDKYVTYRDAYRLRLNGHLTGDPKVDIYSPDDLRYLRDGYRQYVDYSVLGFAAVYLYNILDAVVFAHLYHFDVSNDLSRLRFGPVSNPAGPYGVGFGFTYTFK